MQIVPLKALPNQTVSVILNDQTCQINVYQTNFGLFVDLFKNNELVIGGVIAENQNRIVRSAYLGFNGDLSFIDTQGSSDPEYSGIGTRFYLSYFLPGELV